MDSGGADQHESLAPAGHDWVGGLPEEPRRPRRPPQDAERGWLGVAVAAVVALVLGFAALVVW